MPWLTPPPRHRDTGGKRTVDIAPCASCLGVRSFFSSRRCAAAAFVAAPRRKDATWGWPSRKPATAFLSLPWPKPWITRTCWRPEHQRLVEQLVHPGQGLVDREADQVDLGGSVARAR